MGERAGTAKRGKEGEGEGERNGHREEQTLKQSGREIQTGRERPIGRERQRDRERVVRITEQTGEVCTCIRLPFWHATDVLPNHTAMMMLCIKAA